MSRPSIVAEPELQSREYSQALMLNLDAELPTPSSTRLAVRVSADALRQLRGGHPWIWDGSIERLSADGATGDLAVIFDDKRNFAGIGLWDPDGAIAIRMLHHGSPQTIDAGFFADRLLEAYTRRQPLHDDQTTTAYRLVHGENDLLPGLVVDKYEDTLVVKLDSPVWVPWLRMVIPPLLELSEATNIVLRSSRRIGSRLPEALQGSPTIVGTPPSGPIEFLEYGLRFEADVERGQKTGYFLDQRDNRRLVGARCADASVLDVFCNRGGFSVAAAAGGARSVHSVDSSEHAIDASRRHMETNRADQGFTATHTTVVADAFDTMQELVDRRQRFDVIVVDPPSFAPNAASVASASRAYQRLTALAVELLASGGTLFQASCSSRVTSDEFFHLVTQQVRLSGYQATQTVRTSHALDHPIGFSQGAYLKAVLTDIVPSRD